MPYLSTPARAVTAAITLTLLVFTSARGSDGLASDDYDQLLDARVRDGFVYYRALKADRVPLDRYVRSLAEAEPPGERRAQIAFWLNAYNAVVLQTIVDHYPIATRTAGFPAHSIRQIAGAFDRRRTIAGRTISLDGIEQSVLAEFHDPRVFFALGRGAAGGGRLRSEIYTADRLDRQLEEQADECATRDRCVRVDRAAGILRVNAIFSWRKTEFIDAYARADAAGGAKRPAIGQAVIGFLQPRVIETERAFLASGQAKIEYLPFDWSLNDLAARRR